MKRMQDLQAGCLSDDSDDDTKGKATKANKGTKRKASAVKVKKESKAVKREASSDEDDEDDDNEDEDEDEEAASPAKKRTKRTQRSSKVIEDDPVKKVKANIKVKRRAGSDEEGSSADETAPKGSNIYVHPDLLAALGVTEVATRPQVRTFPYVACVTYSALSVCFTVNPLSLRT